MKRNFIKKAVSLITVMSLSLSTLVSYSYAMPIEDGSIGNEIIIEQSIEDSVQEDVQESIQEDITETEQFQSQIDILTQLQNAEARIESGSSYFSDSFNGTTQDFFGKWTTFDGGTSTHDRTNEWRVENGKLLTGGAPGTKAIVNYDTVNLLDLELEVDVQANGINNDNAGVLFRVQSGATNGWDGCYAYQATIANDARLELGRMNPNGYDNLISAPVPTVNGRIKVVAVGNNIKVYLNGVEYINYTDTDAAAIVRPGTVGLRTYWSPASFGNFVVREYSETKTAAPTINVPSGQYEEAQAVIITPSSGTTVYYTTDGTIPSKNSLSTTRPIELDVRETQIIKAYAEQNGKMVSDIVSRAYILGYVKNTYTEDFESQGDWVVYQGGVTSRPNTWAFDGKAQVINTEGGKIFNPNMPAYENFIADVTINPGRLIRVSGSQNTVGAPNASGIVVRAHEPENGWDSPKGYFIGISPRGFVEIGILHGERWTALSQTVAPIVSPEDDYKLTVYSEGSTYYVFVNNEYVTKFTNDIFTQSGSIALRAVRPDSTASYSNLTVKDIERVADKAAMPTFTPSSSTFVSSIAVAIESTTEGATIYYTTDGSTPTEESSIYTGELTLTQTTTVKAIAVADGFAVSDVATATYTKGSGDIQIESFTAEQLGDFAQYPASQWNISDGNLNVVSGRGYKAVLADSNYSNIDFSVDVTATNNADDAGVLFRVQGASTGVDNVVGYYTGINLSRNRVILGRMNNNWTEIASSPVVSSGINGNEKYNLRVVAVGSLIKVYLDDELQISHIDPTYSSGSIGFRVYQTGAAYTNLKVLNYNPDVAAESFTEIDVTTRVNTAPNLPETIKAIDNYGGTITGVPVEWDEIDPTQYAQVGSFFVEGTVFGTLLKPRARVTVVEGQLDPATQQAVPNSGILEKTPFIPLPLGSVEATGYLRTQLENQKEGITGKAEQLFAELSSNSAWLGGSAANSDWERPTYYVKGLSALAYTLKDDELIGKLNKWVEWALESQQEDGSFGPASDSDWWPRMPMLYALKDHYEATGDERVIDFLTKYFTYENKELDTRGLGAGMDFNGWWSKTRFGDNAEVALWLYNRITNESDKAAIVELVGKLRNQGYDITNILTNNNFFGFANDFQPNHGVNVAQYIKTPAILWQISKDQKDFDAYKIGDEHLMREHGQVTGMPSNTEFLAGLGSTQGVEMCATVERMQSDEIAQMILGDPLIGDHLEKVVFNEFTGGLIKDFTGYQYYTMPNQVASTVGSRGFRQDYSDGNNPGYISGFPCCTFNVHMGWPYYVKNMWAATSSDGTTVDGLAALAYGPSEVTTMVNGKSVTIKQQTNYPFEDTIRLTVECEEDFNLSLRIPNWTFNATVNGEHAINGSYFETTVSNGQTINIVFPMEVKASTWVSDSVAIERGPLVYSLEMDETWTAKGLPVQGLNRYTVTSDTTWNYGLVLDRSAPNLGITVNDTGKVLDNPFEQSQTPISLTARAKKVNNWSLAPSELNADEVPLSPVLSSEPEQLIKLIPYGAENLRITNFPVIADRYNYRAKKYEAESAQVNRVRLRTDAGSYTSISGGGFVGEIDYTDSTITFNNVTAPETKTYKMEIAYATGMAGYVSHALTVNGVQQPNLRYSSNDGWNKFSRIYVEIPLNAGDNNTIVFRGLGSPNFAELDYIAIYETDDSYNPTAGEITITSSSNAITEKGGTLQMTAAIEPAEASQAVVWSVLNESGKANISKDGLLIAIENGTVTVIATAADGTGAKATKQITISGQGQSEEKAFADSFNRAEVGSSWSSYSGQWTIQNKALTVNGGMGFKNVNETTNFSDFVLEADVSIDRTAQTAHNAGLLFRVSNAGNGADNLNGYYAGITGNNTVQVGRFIKDASSPNGRWFELANIPYTIAPGAYYRMKVEAKGRNIDVYINGDHVVSVVDRIHKSGSIGMRTWLTNASFSNVAVYNVEEHVDETYDFSNILGAVFVPTNAINEIQHWKFYDPEINERELFYAEYYGINGVRVYLHYFNWKYDKENLMKNLEDFLTRADNHGIKVELVFFDDCWDANPNWSFETEDLAPVYGRHNSRWLQSPGNAAKDDYNNPNGVTKAEIKQYVTDIVTAHKEDERILLWNIYNEPGNGQNASRTAVTRQLMNDARIWIKDVNPTHPVSSTGGIRQDGSIEFLGDPYSDFITYHEYSTAYYAPYGYEKDVLVDETMNRGRDGNNQTVTGVVENFLKKGLGFMMWELGIGRDNVRFAWGDPYSYEPTVPFHGMIYPDGHPWEINDAKATMGYWNKFDTAPRYMVQYFNDANFQNLVKTSITPIIDFDLGDETGTGSPDPTAGIGKDNFSIRWSGSIEAKTAGDYTFFADSDNVAKIIVDGETVVNKTTNARSEVSGTKTLTAGNHAVIIEYSHNKGMSSMHVKWQGAGFAKQVIVPVYTNNPVESVSLPQTLSLLEGKTATLIPTFTPVNATNQAVIWSSSDTEVAAVSSTGIVRAVAGGTATITATTADGGKTASCLVTVTAIVPPSIEGYTLDSFDSQTISPDWNIVNQTAANWSLTARPGYLRINSLGGDMHQSQNTHRNVFVKNANAPSGNFEVILEVETEATLNYQQAGIVIWQDQDNYIRLGRVHNSHNGGKSIEMAREQSAVYQEASRVNVNRFPTGDKVYIRIMKIGNIYTGYVWDGAQWVEAAPAVTATLNNPRVGLYALASTGSVSMNADFGYFGVREITATSPTEITLNTSNMETGIGTKFSLSASIKPETAASTPITWSSNNETVATVDQSGNVTSHAVGTAIITAQAGSVSATCTVTVTEASMFVNPIVPASTAGGGAADPWVTFKDGYHYYCKVDDDTSITVVKTKRLSDIGFSERKVVYRPTGSEPNRELWAPELHYVKGDWYIYYTAGAGANHRMYALKANTQDAQGTYTFMGKMTDPTDRWAIDGTVLELPNGDLYKIWSGWPGFVDEEQCLYIAKMSDPVTISGERVRISRPEESWELNGRPLINEGPQILQKDGKIFVVYSASGSWSDDYCLGMLTYVGTDYSETSILNPSNWEKTPEAVFSKAPMAFGVGHASFTTSPDGTEDWIVYHAMESSGGGWGNRSTRAQKFTWNEDGTPNFGTPLPYGSSVYHPSGTSDILEYRIEAEDATLGGGASAVTRGNASGKRTVGNITATNGYVEFKVNVSAAGEYSLAAMATAASNAVQTITVNGEQAKDITYPGRGLNGFNPSNTYVKLVKGENTIRFTGKTSSAEIDYIVLQLPTDAKISIIGGEVREGQSIEVLVNVSGNINASGVKFRIEYDKTKIIPESYEKLGAVGEEGSLQSNIDKTGIELEKLDFISFVWANAEDVNIDGDILRITFKAIEKGEAPLTLSSGEITSENLSSIPFTPESGIVKVVLPVIPGNIDDSDNVVDTKDLIKLMRYLAAWKITLTPDQEQAADFNADGKIDVKDAVLLLQHTVKSQS